MIPNFGQARKQCGFNESNGLAQLSVELVHNLCAQYLTLTQPLPH